MPVLHSTLPHTEQERLRILSHLEELMESPAFSGSSRRQAFLRYVVEESLAGRGHAIKERNLAVDVFERNNDFDAQSVSIVRVTGGEVRKRLAQAYASGLDRGLRIELPLGSYQPIFHFASVDSAPSIVAVAELPLVKPAIGERKHRKWALGWIAAVAAAGILVAGVLCCAAPPWLRARLTGSGNRSSSRESGADSLVSLTVILRMPPAESPLDSGKTRFRGKCPTSGPAERARRDLPNNWRSTSEIRT